MNLIEDCMTTTMEGVRSLTINRMRPIILMCIDQKKYNYFYEIFKYLYNFFLFFTHITKDIMVWKKNER